MADEMTNVGAGTIGVARALAADSLREAPVADLTEQLRRVPIRGASLRP